MRRHDLKWIFIYLYISIAADATGTMALLVCLAMGALYQQPPLKQKSTTTPKKAEKSALLPR